jgi:hypothetical protein
MGARRWAGEFQRSAGAGEVWKDGDIVWTKSNLQTSENRQKNEKRDAHFFLSRLGITDKKGHL